MKKTNFTYSLAKLKMIWLSAVFFLFAGGIIHVQAQDGCAMACNSWTQVSLDEECGATIVPSMLLNGEETSCEMIDEGVYSVYVKYQGQVIDGSPDVGEEWIGYTLKAQITHNDSGNSCWGDIYIEDKLPPDITCSDVTISCFEEDTYLPDAVDACEGPVMPTLVNQWPVDFDCENDGDEIKILMRVYVASDSKGNVSDPCTVKVTLDRIDIGAVECPQDYTLADGNALVCNDVRYWQDDDGEYILDDDGNKILDPDFYGVPTYEYAPGLYYDLWPNPTFKCGLSVTFEDTELETINCVRKIMRIWTVREWYCTAEFLAPDCLPLPGAQIFEIDDNIDPVIEADYDFEVSTNGYTCEMNVHIPEPRTLSDECFGIDHVDVLIDIEDEEVPDIFIPNFNYEDGEYHLLPDGEHLVTYTAYDLCHNSSSDELSITVKDHTPPVVVCDEFTVISVTLDGEAEVHANVFDNGSYDDCHLKQLLVRRMDDGCPDCETPKFDGFDYLGYHLDYFTGDPHYYYLSHYKFKGNKAHKIAEAMGGYVASYNHPTEEDWVNSAVRGYTDDSYWIGLTDAAEEDNFYWADGSYPYYYNWGGGEPSNGSDDYVEVDADDSDQWNAIQYNEERRYVLEIYDPCGWSSYERFCCDDIGGEDVMVAMRAIDRWGNYNDCMVSAEIQDKLPPQITCPPDLTIECGFDWPSLDVFGTVRENQEDVQAIVIPGDYLINSSDPHLYDGFAVDNCDVTVTMDPEMDGIDQCGLGTIYRHFTATDPGQRTATCTQKITFKQKEPFYVRTDYTGDYPFDDVDWPSDFEGEGCENPEDYDPEDLNPPYDRPVIYEDECDLVATTHEDHVFLFNNDQADACFKILRKWKLIDWCQFDPVKDPEEYSWTWTQVIKVNNFVAPVLTSSTATIDTCTYDPVCDTGPVELIMTAMDGEVEDGPEGPQDAPCTPAEFLRWEYKIDIDNDGSFDEQYTRTGTGGTADASGEYPIGHHSIRWTFEDRCGNKVTADQLFNIINCKAPTPYCYDGLAVDLMILQEGGGMVTLWADDFDAGSNHVCPDTEVIVTFAENDLDSIFRVFTCDDLGTVMVDLWAHTITPQGIVASKCTASLDVQDNPDGMGNTACEEGEGEMALVSGLIANEMSENLMGVSVDLEGSELMAVTTDEVGEYAFPEMPTGGSYTVNPTKNVDHLNGVSTLDLVLIQKYILGLQDLDSPYKIIAADVNLDEKVSASDIVELRKLILGVVTNFQNNESWRFVDQSFTFNDPTDPLEEAFPEVYAITNLNSNMDVDFTAVKVGDVNTSAEMNEFTNTEVRGLAQLGLEIADWKVEAGELVSIPVRLSESVNLLGYQFTFEFDQTAISIQNVDAGTIAISDENFGMNRLQEGVLTTSWHDSKVATLTSGDVLFTLNVKANTDVQLSEVLNISSRITDAEAYSSDTETMDLVLEFRTDGGESFTSYKLYQNTPNPFSNNTVIAFNLPRAMDASISVHDVTGKQVSLIRGLYAKGYNEIELSSSDLNVSGVMYYTLETEEFTATKKMVVLK